MRERTYRTDSVSPENTARKGGGLTENGYGDVGASPGDVRLVAYVVPALGVDRPNAAELRTFLQSKLPDYAIPTDFVWLDALPRTSNGKVNRSELPAPDTIREERNQGFIAPRTAAEGILATIWSDVLGAGLIGIHDNFFEIGGDSILSIQIIAKARQAGLALKPNQLFDYPTIAELAGIAEVAGVEGDRTAAQEPVVGRAPLTPIQRWFFEQPFPEPHHWNQTLWLEMPSGLRLDALDEAFHAVFKHHDALRLRFVCDNDGWHSVHGEWERGLMVRSMDVSAEVADDLDAAIIDAAITLQNGMDLAEGPLMRAALFERGEHIPNLLLIAIHHLIVDLVSWQILLQDLETAYEQCSRGVAVSLPRKTTSYKDWSEALATYANSEDLKDEHGFWLSLPRTGVRPVPRDLDGGFTEASARTLVLQLDADETQALLRDVPSAYNTRTEDVLLTALAQSFQSWTQSPSLLVGLELHGREELTAKIDLSRTIGWFTSYFPVVLDLTGVESPGNALKLVKEGLRAIPRQGLDFGVLRYLSRDPLIADAYRAIPEPEIIFSYAGRAGLPSSSEGLFKPLQPLSISRSAVNQRKHVLEINAFIAGERLTVNWTYSGDVHRKETMDRVTSDYMHVLRSLLRHCLSPEAGGYSPSDFPDADLNQEDLDRFIGGLFS